MQKVKKSIVSLVLVLAMVLSFLPMGLVTFAADTVTITFDSQGGSSVASLTNVPKSTTSSTSSVTFPTNPTKTGYTFAGWYTTSDGKQYTAAVSTGGGYYGPLKLVVGDTDETYYAQWIKDDGIKTVPTKEGSGSVITLGISKDSGKGLIYANSASADPYVDPDTYVADGTNPVFKDLNGNHILDPYEDWRLPVETRAADIASKMSTKEIAGLMLFSAHQTDFSSPVPTNEQINFLTNDDLRHVLIAGASTAENHAKWNNNVQAITERLGLGIPANNSSDPRHSAAVGVEFYSNNTGTMSIWPNSLGLAASFDPDIMLQFAKIASKEYRAFGISTALSPQIDIATDPRWNRTNGTFGEDPKLSAEMAAAYVKGFQGTFDGTTNNVSDQGYWGYDSVNAMIKHWPGGGAGEAGRDAHSDFGKYAIYPGNNFEAHIVPFVDGALSGAKGSIERATAVMPYYTISNNIDPTGTDVANALSSYMIDDLLVDKYGFDGVVCTDWGVNSTRGWGPSIEDQNEGQRTLQLIMSGINQLGGVNTQRFILEAKALAASDGKEAEFNSKMETSAKKILLNVFKSGLFENPYLNVAKSVELAKNADNNQAGFDAQVKAIVTLKNTVPDKAVTVTTKVYVPKNANGSYAFSNKVKGQEKFVYTDDPNQADIAIVPINSPSSPPDPQMGFFGGGWYAKNSGRYPEGYFPLTLQYSEYTAVDAREVSIAGDYRDKDVDESPSILNRTYKDKVLTSTNLASFKTLAATKEAMGKKPVITVLNLDNPTVMTEIDAVSDVVLARFACSDAAVLEILSGNKASTGMLPIQMPKNMAAVEAQKEDVPRDLECYVDSEGHTYDFGYGLTVKDGQVKVIDASINPNYTKFVTDNADPMKKPDSSIDNGIGNYVSFETVSLPVGVVDQPYSATIKTKETGSTITLKRVEQNEKEEAGDLQAGLTFNNGVISGTPTKAGCVQLVVYGEAASKEGRLYRLNLLVNDEASKVNPDPNELSMQLTLASAKKLGNYSFASWDTFSNALLNAQAVYSTATSPTFTATKEEIDNAVADLKDAITELKEPEKNATLITKVQENGQDVIAVALDLGEGKSVNKASLDKNNFTVKAINSLFSVERFSGTRKVTNVYPNSEINVLSDPTAATNPASGRYVIVELENGNGVAGASTFTGGTIGRNALLDLNYNITVAADIKDASNNALLKKDVSYGQKAGTDGRRDLIIEKFSALAKAATSADAKNLHYSMYTPEVSGDTKYPLVLWLHGGGEGAYPANVNDPNSALVYTTANVFANMGATAWVQAQLDGVTEKAYVVAPQADAKVTAANAAWTSDDTKWDWTEWSRAGSKDIVRIDALLKELIAANPNIDTRRIYITGCSMGGGQTYAQIIYSQRTSGATKFAAAMPICPAWSVDEIPGRYNGAKIPESDLNSLLNMPMWVFHSQNDTVIPFANSTATVNKVNSLGPIELRNTWYDKIPSQTGTDFMGHFAWVRVLNNEVDATQSTLKTPFEWLFSHKNEESTGGNGGGNNGGSGATTTPSPTPTPTTSPGDVNLNEKFSDAEKISSWALPFIQKLVNEKILEGRENGTIDPLGDITRAEFVKMIVTALDFKASGTPKSFIDVNSGDWFKSYIDIASGNGLILGVSDYEFAPNEKIMRQDICVIMLRALKAKGITLPEAEVNNFLDSGDIATYAVEAVNMLKQLEIVVGRDNGMFDPRTNATREETAKITCGIMDYVAKAPVASATPTPTGTPVPSATPAPTSSPAE